MKTSKSLFLLTLICCLVQFSFSQKMYNVHQDNVKPSKLLQYEETAKTFLEACKKHNPKTSWIVANTNDFKYLYITPIENFADLDKQPFTEMAKTMGDSFGELFEKFDECYESHGNYIIILDEELTYMPNGITQMQNGQNYRKWFYVYFTPENAKKIREGFKAVKKLYESKNAKEYYRVYRNGFGTPENYYLVAVSSKDKVDGATKSKENEQLLGPEGWNTFKKVMDYADRFEEMSGNMRTDLSYSSK